MSASPTFLPPAKGGLALEAYARHHWDLDAPDLPGDLRMFYARVARCLACIGWGMRYDACDGAGRCGDCIIRGKRGQCSANAAWLVPLLDDLFEAYSLALPAYDSVKSRIRQPAGVVVVLGNTSPTYSSGAMRFIGRTVEYARILGSSTAEIAEAARNQLDRWRQFGWEAASDLGTPSRTTATRLGDVAERVLAELRQVAASEGSGQVHPGGAGEEKVRDVLVALAGGERLSGKELAKAAGLKRDQKGQPNRTSKRLLSEMRERKLIVSDRAGYYIAPEGKRQL